VALSAKAMPANSATSSFRVSDNVPKIFVDSAGCDVFGYIAAPRLIVRIFIPSFVIYRAIENKLLTLSISSRMRPTQMTTAAALPDS